MSEVATKPKPAEVNAKSPTAEKAAILPKPKVRFQPDVFIGQVVLYYRGGYTNDIPVPAIVRSVGERCIEVVLVDGVYGQPSIVSSLYHANSPLLTEAIRRSVGIWDHTEFTKMVGTGFRDLAARLSGTPNDNEKAA